MTKNMFEDALMLLPWSTLDEVKQLISLGAEVKEKDSVALLRKAVKLNDAMLLKDLLKRTGGVEILRKQDSVYSPGLNEYIILSKAMSKDVGLPVLKVLVENGFNINAGISPLLHRGNIWNIRPKNDSEALMLRKTNAQNLMPQGEGKEEKMAYLKSKGLKKYLYKTAYNTSEDEGKKIWECLYNNDTNGLKKILDAGASPNILKDMNDGYFSPLAEAYIGNKPEIAKVLVQSGGLAILSDYQDHSNTVYTIRDFLDGKAFKYVSISDESRKKWEEVAQMEEMLREKFPFRADECAWFDFSDKDRTDVAENRKEMLHNLLVARTSGDKNEARKISQEFHKRLKEEKISKR